MCSLNSELEECHKSAIEKTVWSPVLKYEPFVMGRNLVHALVESWVLESKAFRIDRREVPLLVYDMALLTGLLPRGNMLHLTMGKVHVRWRTW